MRGACIAAALLLGLAVACDGAQAAPLRVLFVGNSLTAANDLPGMVEALAAGRIAAGSIAPGGFALEDHWASGPALSMLASGDWDAVVMQQGPSSLPESRVNLVEWSKRWADEARAHGVRPALLTVWPEAYRASYAFGAVIGSYRAAAAASHSVLLPAGVAWRLALRRAPKLPLYGPDGFHPGPLGTYLAALVVCRGLIGTVPSALPPGVHASPSRLRVLRAAVADAYPSGS